MRVFVGEAKLSTIALLPRPMGFGEPLECEQPLRLEVTADEFRQALAKDFNDFVESCKDEDDPSAPEVPELRSAGYPDFSRCLAEFPALLVSIIENYLALELVEGLFARNDPSKVTHGVNSVATVRIGSDGVTVLGTAYSASHDPDPDRGG